MTKIPNIVAGGLFLLLAGFSCQVNGAHAKPGETKDAPAETKNHTDEKMTVKEFISWCADKENGLKKEKDISDIRFNLSYLPPATMAFLELRTEPYDFSRFQKTCADYSEMTYFNFRIEAMEGNGELLKYRLQSPQQYDSRIKYMSFDMQRDLCLIQGRDTLLPGLFQFERAFEVVPYATVMFAFDNNKFDRNNEFTIVYNDRLFEKGYVKFNYKNKQLINLPNISGS